MADARVAQIERATRETEIRLLLNVDGRGQASVETGIGFFDHMLTALALNGRFDLEVEARGDLHVSQHHTVEDVGIVLGKAIAQAAGSREGIHRYGSCLLPMDEALVRTVLDLSGRAWATVEISWSPQLGPCGFDYALTTEFFWAVARGAALTVHVDGLRGRSNHHLCEAAFKGFGRALASALAADPRLAGATTSTKGSFDS